MEKTLDIVNLVLSRKTAQLEVERLGKLQTEQPAKSWFSSWWSSSSADDEGEKAASSLGI